MMRFFYDLHGEVCAFSEADLQVLGARIAEYKELTPESEPGRGLSLPAVCVLQRHR